MSKAWAGGSSRRWRQIRALILATNPPCRIALPGVWRTRTRDGVRCLGYANTVHHLHGKNRCAGCKADLLTHLAPACSPCNQKVGDPGRAAPTQRPKIKTMTHW